MFPLRDDIPAKVFPVVNIGLIGANFFWFFYTLGQGGLADQFLTTYGFVPARFLAYSSLSPAPERILPLFSSMFLHGGLLHLVTNMWMLWIFGDNVEDAMGHGRYLAFYLLCGLGSVAAQTWAAPGSNLPMVGASGAISGVLGAYFLTYPRARILTLVPLLFFLYLVELPAFYFLGIWFLLQFLQGWAHLFNGESASLGGVAWWAHVGGFGAGVLLVRMFRKGSRRGRPRRRLRL
ncbi:MAG: rhomboid family intramembrane serine protease [Desulfobulbaceae bacterium]|nr:rhomboid family intramembrane serine protease [Desulfobulbaceae bacterium]